MFLTVYRVGPVIFLILYSMVSDNVGYIKLTALNGQIVRLTNLTLTSINRMQSDYRWKGA